MGTDVGTLVGTIVGAIVGTTTTVGGGTRVGARAVGREVGALVGTASVAETAVGWLGGLPTTIGPRGNRSVGEGGGARVGLGRGLLGGGEAVARCVAVGGTAVRVGGTGVCVGGTGVLVA